MRSSLAAGVLLLAALAGCGAPEPSPREDVAPVERVRGPRDPDRARLLVDSVPSDAVVRLDGRLAGTTPLELDDLEPGRHVVLVRHARGTREERIECARGATATVVVTSWRDGTEAAASPEELGRRIALALRERDLAVLEPLLLDRGEVERALGGADSDRVRLGLVARLEEDFAQLVGRAQRARRLRVAGLATSRSRLSRDPFVEAVEVAANPALVIEGRGTETVSLGPMVRVQGSWKLLTLLPSRGYR